MKTQAQRPLPAEPQAESQTQAPQASLRDEVTDDHASSFARAELYGHRLASEPSAGHPLPSPVQRKMERSFGVDFSRVRVHQGRHVEHLGAAAYTRGERLHFAPGQYSPMSAHGQEMLGHELAHVVQQREGRVPRGAADALNADPKLEAEADSMAAAVTRGDTATPTAES